MSSLFSGNGDPKRQNFPNEKWATYIQMLMNLVTNSSKKQKNDERDSSILDKIAKIINKEKIGLTITDGCGLAEIIQFHWLHKLNEEQLKVADT